MRKLLCLCLFFLSLAYNAFAQDDDDPDLPRSANTKIKKEEFFKSKEEYFSSRQMTLRPLNYNPKVAATEAMKTMESNQRSNPLSRVQAPYWVQLGPSPTPNGQTTTNSVAVSGRVTAIVVHPSNSNIVYIGTANGGVYRSMNAGTSWTAIFDNAQSLAIGALALAPSNPSILYVGTGEPQLSSDSYAGVGIYRIDNADASPNLVGPINPNYSFTYTGGGTITTKTFGYNSVSKILVHPTDPATIFVATTTGTASNPSANYIPNTIGPIGLLGLYRSTNATAAAGSVTFTKLAVTDAGSFDLPNTGHRRITDMVMEPGNPSNLVCWVYDAIVTSTTQGGGAYRTTNALAATPAFTKTYASPLGSVRGELGIAKVGSTVTVYAGAGGATGNGEIIKSIDGGITFTGVTGTYTFCSGQCFYDIAVAVDPTDDQKVFIGGSSGSNIFRYSVNGGTSFTASTTNLHADVHALTVDPTNVNTIYLGCDGGIFKSINAGVNWTSLNSVGLHATQFQSIALHPTDPKFTLGGTQDNGTQMLKPDGTFTRVDYGDGGYALIDQNAVNTSNVTMYHTYFNNSALNGFARSDIGTAAFENWGLYGCNGSTANGISCTGTVLFYAPMALGPGNPNTVYYGSNAVYRSVDKGVINTAVSQAFTSPISSIAVSPLDDNYRIIGLRNGQVWATITGTATLVNITPAGAPSAPVGRVFINPANKSIAYVTYAGYFGSSNPHIYKTSTLAELGGTGVLWTGAATGLPDVPVNCFTMIASNPNTLFCGTDVGVFTSTDAGANWSSFNTGLPVVPVFDMAIHPASKVLRIATHGRGLWETSSSPLPVTFTSFEANVLNRTKVLLQWFTASETNNKGFDVERAVLDNGGNRQWIKVGFVKGSGNTSSPRRYELEDVPVGGRKFIYRLRQIDYDNNFKYSENRQVTLSNFDFALFPIFPNPVTQNATIRYQVPDESLIVLLVYNAAGQLIKSVANEKKEAGIYEAALSVDTWPKGTYYLRLNAGNYHDVKPFVVSK